MESKINSSNVLESDRAATSGRPVDQCNAIYTKIQAGHALSMIDWGDTSVSNFDDWLNDVINRLIKVIS